MADDLAPTPSDTRLTLAHIMSAHDTNLMGTVHGGKIMKLVDDAAGTVAARYSGGPAVTASMDEMLFLAPVRVGDVVTVNAQVNWAGRTSMEVGARVETTRWDELSAPVHVATAYLVMVAVSDDGTPRSVRDLRPTTDEEQRRFREATIRRAHRLARRQAIQDSRRTLAEPAER
ncbi:acyl-CoA thioesterase [Luteipulveratus mongoliensis]|uniref:Acyl-CoA hydrolase n=1 Tax=Luteipulveratus mongoliensis TaxID=571913 RepID=A0A0K1JF12_9MICO|nr:acyl-CoA thioesterase [Luteipulveratus mongoliensis]AKU15286.1 acyl-CoA hydrolase [Luteipulveratus mongoliensis]